jgi:hypothetical protein
MTPDTEKRLLDSGKALIASNQRKRALLADQTAALISLQAVVDKDAETLAASAEQIAALQIELAAAISGNPDVAAMVAERDAQIKLLTEESNTLKAASADQQAKIAALIADDEAEDANILALVQQVEEELAVDAPVVSA